MARPAGAQNKVSGAAKENITAVFTRMGGTAAMAKWAEENQTEFYRIYSKLVSVDAKVSVDGNVTIQIVTGVPE